MTGTLALAVRLARRELRGGLRGFRVFLACLGLGVAAIAGVGSVSSAMYDGIGRDARVLIGGDVELRLTHRELPADQIAHLKASGRVSEAVEMRAMAGRAGGERALVELKAVDGLYPLFGALTFDPPGELGAALAVRDGDHGALVEPALAARLGLAVGDRLTVGDASLVVSGTIAKEPDRVASFASFGPRLLVSTAALDATGLVHEGSLIRYHARVALPDGTDVKAWIEDLKQRYPTGGWRVRSLENASPGLDRFISRVTQYLTLVGLTALLVGGVGIANAVRAFLDRRLATIATLKCLGAPGGLVFAVYLIQVLALATVGIAGGLVVGALAPPLAGFAMERFLPFAMPSSIYWQPLLMAAAFGYLITLAFSLWPLGRAREVRAAQLFRALIVPPGGRPRAGYVAATVAAVVVLAALAVLVADDMRLALWFVAGALAVFAAFVAAAVLIMRLARRLPAPRWPGLRLAVANLHRPGAATPSVLLSLGLGLTVLVAIAQVQTNLNRQITERLPEQAPSYFFIDIQPDQIEGFETLVRGLPGVAAVDRAPMLRASITETYSL